MTQSMAEADGYRLRTDVAVPMADGCVLRADVYRPALAGSYPVLLQRTPYDKSLGQQNVYAHPSFYARAGFVVVVQDVRGRYASEGSFYPFRHEASDGADSVTWCAELDGSSGDVFMYGYSYAGFAALLAAAARPRGLAGIMPAMTSADAREGWLYRDGVLRLGFAHAWALQLAEHTAIRAGEVELAQRIAARAAAGPGRLPVTASLDGDMAEHCRYFADWLDYSNESYWNGLSALAALESTDVPALLVAGWYDEFLTGTLAAFDRLAQRPAQAPARLVIGPWCHAPWTRHTGAVDFGPSAVPDVDSLQVQWVREVLDGRRPRGVRYFTMGSNQWQEARDWPPTAGAQRCLYLSSAGGANTGDGDGRLGSDPGGPADHLWSDPRTPVPSLRGRDDAAARTHWGPVDQAVVENRRDVLCYTTEPLEAELAICGRMSLNLWIGSSAAGFDLHVSINALSPEGRSYPFSRGVRRVVAQDPAAAPPADDASGGRPREVSVELDDTGMVLPAGHRLRLTIAGTSFPAFVRTPHNDVRDHDATVAQLRLATHRVYHDRDRPSRLTFDTPTQAAVAACAAPGEQP